MRLDIRGEHPLRGPRGARRVEDRHRVPGLDRPLRRRRLGAAVEQLVSVDHLDPGDGGEPVPNPGDDREITPALALPEPLNQPPVGNREPGPGVLDHVSEDVPPTRSVDRNVNGPQVVDREPEPHDIRPVRQPNNHRIPLLNPQRLQPRGSGPGQLQQLRVSPLRPILKDRKNVPRSLRRPALEHVPQNTLPTPRSPREHEIPSPRRLTTERSVHSHAARGFVKRRLLATCQPSRGAVRRQEPRSVPSPCPGRVNPPRVDLGPSGGPDTPSTIALREFRGLWHPKSVQRASGP